MQTCTDVKSSIRTKREKVFEGFQFTQVFVLDTGRNDAICATSPLEGEGEAPVGAPGRRVPHAVALGGALPHVLRRPLEGDGVDGEVDALAVAVVAVEEAVADEELESPLSLIKFAFCSFAVTLAYFVANAN